MSAAQMTTARIVAAAVVAVFLMTTVIVLNWPTPTAAAPKADTKTVVKEVTPPGCSRFVRTSDAFVEVTNDFLAAQNEALTAVIDQDGVALDTAIDYMGKVKTRYDKVLDRYSDARAGCL